MQSAIETFRKLTLWLERTGVREDSQPQASYEVSWAGDPNKPVEEDERDGSLRLGPRTKFEMQRCMLKGLAEQWKPDEVEAVSVL